MEKNSFYIKTLGCKVNQYESEVMRENFLRSGYSEAKGIDDADVCVVNTCTVTSTSDTKSLKIIRRMLEAGNKCVIATGCMVENADLDLLKLKGVNFIIKNKDKYDIPYIVENSSPFTLHPSPSGIATFEGHDRAFVKVQDGCDNACSYCKVRLVRGHSRSRSVKEVVKESGALIKNNFKEIVLTGICLGAYGRDFSEKTDLSELIKELCGIEGGWRLRLSSIEPKDVTEKLIAQFRSQNKLCRHIPMPFQSGDDGVLKSMCRPYGAGDYLNIVSKVRKYIPDIAISTDIMVGFPGETDKAFQNTLDFIKAARPMRTHVFPYSKRKGTVAYGYEDTPAAVKKEREGVLLALAKELASEFAGKFIGTDADVLVEGTRDPGGLLTGYTDRYIKVLIDGPDTLKSRIIRCSLASAPLQISKKSRSTAVYGIVKDSL